MEGIRGKQGGGQVMDILVVPLLPAGFHLGHTYGILFFVLNEMEDWDGHEGRYQQYHKTDHNTMQEPALASHYALLCRFFLFAHHPFLHKKRQKIL